MSGYYIIAILIERQAAQRCCDNETKVLMKARALPEYNGLFQCTSLLECVAETYYEGCRGLGDELLCKLCALAGSDGAYGTMIL